MTKEELAASSIEQLMRVQSVKNVLGTTQKIEKKDSDVFYRGLQPYFDSKEKSTKKKDKGAPPEKKTNGVLVPDQGCPNLCESGCALYWGNFGRFTWCP
jgi:hypothetical protein